MREVFARALRRQRVVATSALVLVVLSAIAVQSWLPEAVSWRREVTWKTGQFSVEGSLVGFIAYFGYLGLVRFRSASRAGLRVDLFEHALYAPPRRAFHSTTAAACLVAFQVIVLLEGIRGEPFWVVPLAGALAGAVYARLDQWRRVPAVMLTPDGIEVGHPRRAFFVPWSAIEPQEPIVLAEHNRTLRLRLVRPKLVEGRRLRRRPGTMSPKAYTFGRFVRRDAHEQSIDVGDIDVSPQVLAAAIRHYARHPEHRTAIGSYSEHARLGHALDG